MGMWIGAQLEPVPHAPMTHAITFGLLGDTAFLHVNAFGERFHNEDVSGQAWNYSVEQQPGKFAWQIIDANWQEYIPHMSIGHCSNFVVTDALKSQVEKSITANSIEELAVALELDPATLKATVDRYNEMCYAGIDTDFGKPSHRLFPIDTPPYHAGKGGACSFLAVLFGGLMTDPHTMQAYDTDFKLIRGLYLAGNTVGRRFNVSYPTTVPGVSVGMAITQGRYAAQQAVLDDGKNS
jgi:hypothetical protein